MPNEHTTVRVRTKHGRVLISRTKDPAGHIVSEVYAEPGEIFEMSLVEADKLLKRAFDSPIELVAFGGAK